MTDIIFTPAADDDPSFTPTTTTNHNTLPGRSAAGAHPAASIVTDNDWDGNLAGAGTDLATVLDAIDDLTLGGGAVDSVNGEVGVVVLDAADVGAVPNDAVGLLPGETNRGTWDVAETYAVGDVVYEPGDDLYVATAPSTGAQPSLTPGSWDVLDPSGRHVQLGPGATAGGYGTAIAPLATAGDAGTAVGFYATAGDFGLSVGPYATSGDYATSIGLLATAGDFGVNIANVYKGTLDPGDPSVPTGATIATGFVDLPETADATNPAADHQRLIARTDGLYVRDETGTEVGPLGATEWSGITGKPSTFAPSAHAASHQDGGSDELALDGSQITSGTVAAARLPAGVVPQVIPRQVGGWYASPGFAPLTSSIYSVGAAGRAALVPIFLHAGPVDRLAIIVGTAGTSVWRLGLYSSHPTTGVPDGQPLVVDAGTLDLSTTTGRRELTIAATVPATGIYWGVAYTVSRTNTPTVRAYASTTAATGQAVLLGTETSAEADASGGLGLEHRFGGWGALAALPALCPTTSPRDGGPKIMVRAA